jgi:hypothetical protein
MRQIIDRTPSVGADVRVVVGNVDDDALSGGDLGSTDSWTIRKIATQAPIEISIDGSMRLDCE